MVRTRVDYREARRELAAVCRKHGYDVVGWEPLAGGGLTFLIDRAVPLEVRR